MQNNRPIRIKTITDFHRMRGLPVPEHPLVSVIKVEDIKRETGDAMNNFIYDFYLIALKRNCGIKYRYGQQEYDFDEGTMFFIAPNQVFGIEPYDETSIERTGWMLMFHPDFLWSTILAKKIRQYEFFNYAVHEALFLSEKEEAVLNIIVENISHEYRDKIDKFSQGVIIAQIELLLTYSERFYERQFITRKITNHRILDRLETLLDEYFNNDELISKGLPSVQYISESLNVSPNYLSSLLKVLTGQTTQQHIHNKVIEKAKEKLSTTEMTVSEIAYELGFEHSQSFSKFFKAKTKSSPVEFRSGFN